MVDVDQSVSGGLISSPMEGAIPRAERALREEPAYQQLETQREAERGLIAQARRESGLLEVTPEDLEPVAETPQESPSNPQMSAAWGKVVLDRMEALERSKAAQESAAPLAPKTVAGLAVEAHSDAQLQALAGSPETPATTRHAAATALQARSQADRGNSGQILEETPLPTALPSKDAAPQEAAKPVAEP